MDGIDPVDSVHGATKYLLDVLSVATVIGTLVDALPSIAAGLSIVWTMIRIYETKTIQTWLKDAEDDA